MRYLVNLLSVAFDFYPSIIFYVRANLSQVSTTKIQVTRGGKPWVTANALSPGRHHELKNTTQVMPNTQADSERAYRRKSDPRRLFLISKSSRRMLGGLQTEWEPETTKLYLPKKGNRQKTKKYDHEKTAIKAESQTSKNQARKRCAPVKSSRGRRKRPTHHPAGKTRRNRQTRKTHNYKNQNTRNTK